MYKCEFVNGTGSIEFEIRRLLNGILEVPLKVCCTTRVSSEMDHVNNYICQESHIVYIKAESTW